VQLAEISALSVGGFAVLDNHMHLLARLEKVKGSGGHLLGQADNADYSHILCPFFCPSHDVAG
jgi:hypothetical protein